jgi:dnd system-associated protein 4
MKDLHTSGLKSAKSPNIMRAKRIPRSETQSEVISHLVRDKEGADKDKEKMKYFSEIWELMIFASAIGYHQGELRPLVDANGVEDASSGKSIDQDTFKGCPDWPGYIYLLSLARTGKSDCLNATEECDLERVETFSEYANAGLDLLRREAFYGYKTLEFAQKLMELSDDGSSQDSEELKI